MFSASRRLLRDEVIVFQTKKHKIIFFVPIVLTLLAIYVYPIFTNNPFLAKIIWALVLVPGVFFTYSLVEYMTSIFIVTNKRIMMREGFFNRHTNETLLTSISQVNVDQNLIAQLLNYGTLTVNAFGASDTFVMIAKPYAFQQALNEQVNLTGRQL